MRPLTVGGVAVEAIVEVSGPRIPADKLLPAVSPICSGTAAALTRRHRRPGYFAPAGMPVTTSTKRPTMQTKPATKITVRITGMPAM